MTPPGYPPTNTTTWWSGAAATARSCSTSAPPHGGSTPPSAPTQEDKPMADSSAVPGSVRLEWVYTALASVRNNGPVVALCESLGAKYLAAANATLTRPGYMMGSHTGPVSTTGTSSTSTPHLLKPRRP